MDKRIRSDGEEERKAVFSEEKTTELRTEQGRVSHPQHHRRLGPHKPLQWTLSCVRKKLNSVPGFCPLDASYILLSYDSEIWLQTIAKCPVWGKTAPRLERLQNSKGQSNELAQRQSSKQKEAAQAQST